MEQILNCVGRLQKEIAELIMINLEIELHNSGITETCRDAEGNTVTFSMKLQSSDNIEFSVQYYLWIDFFHKSIVIRQIKKFPDISEKIRAVKWYLDRRNQKLRKYHLCYRLNPPDQLVLNCSGIKASKCRKQLISMIRRMNHVTERDDCILRQLSDGNVLEVDVLLRFQ